MQPKNLGQIPLLFPCCQFSPACPTPFLIPKRLPSSTTPPPIPLYWPYLAKSIHLQPDLWQHNASNITPCVGFPSSLGGANVSYGTIATSSAGQQTCTCPFSPLHCACSPKLLSPDSKPLKVVLLHFFQRTNITTVTLVARNLQ